MLLSHDEDRWAGLLYPDLLIVDGQSLRVTGLPPPKGRYLWRCQEGERSLAKLIAVGADDLRVIEGELKWSGEASWHPQSAVVSQADRWKYPATLAVSYSEGRGKFSV